VAVLSKADFTSHPEVVRQPYANSKWKSEGRPREPATIFITIASTENAEREAAVRLYPPQLPSDVRANGDRVEMRLLLRES